MSDRSMVRSKNTESGVLGTLLPSVPVPESPALSVFGLATDTSSSSSFVNVFSAAGGLGERDGSAGSATAGVSVEVLVSAVRNESSSVAS